MYWITYTVGKNQKDQVKKLQGEMRIFFSFKITKNVSQMD